MICNQKQPPEVFCKKRDSGTGVSCEFYGIFKNTFFTELLWTTASVKHYRICQNVNCEMSNLKNLKPLYQNHNLKNKHLL